MATATEGYVDVQNDRVRTETELTVAHALLTVERRINAAGWRIVGFVIGVGFGVTGVLIALLR